MWYFVCLLSLTAGLQTEQDGPSVGMISPTPPDANSDSGIVAVITPAFESTIKDDGCQASYYGVQCQLECTSPNCVPHAFGPSDVGVTCDKTGAPTSCDMCRAGRWGMKCEKTCRDTQNCDTAHPFHCNKDYGNGLTCSQCKPGWTGRACDVRVTCPALGHTAHGTNNCDPEKAQEFNTTCATVCSPGYAIDGPVATVCRAGAPGSAVGVWSHALPTCQAMACANHEIPGASPCSGNTGDLCEPVPNFGNICVGAMRCEGQTGMDESVFRPVGPDVSCVPLSACDQCDEHASCHVVNGQPACVCDLGYYGSGGVNGCAKCETCEEGFEVSKPCGFKARNMSRIVLPSSHDTMCSDVDECLRKCLPGQISGCNKCQHHCVNLPGSYACSCADGYRLSPDGFSCEPITCRMQSLPNSRHACAGFAGRECDVTEPGFCNAGYFGRGSLTCDETGAWVGDAACEPLLCVASTIDNIDLAQPCAESSLPWDSTFRMPFGESCKLRCAEGYAPTGRLECANVDGSVRFAPAAQCEPATCPDFYVHLNGTTKLQCSGIRTNQECIGGINFECPEGFVARGRAKCLASGRFDISTSNPPRCERLTSDPCKDVSCPNGVCKVDQYDVKAVCVDKDTNRSPYSPSYALGIYSCPPPSVVSKDGTECVSPSGFKESTLSPKSASSVMVGQHLVSKSWKAAQTTCTRVPYNNNYIFDDVDSIKIMTTIQHAYGRTDGPALSNADNPAVTHWVENVTTAYFSVCFSEVGTAHEPHEAVLINYLVYTFLDGVSYGTSLLPQQRYLGASKGTVEKFVRLATRPTTPLVLSSLTYRSGEDSLCDPVHCVCETAHHNPAVVNVGDVFVDEFSLHFSEMAKYRKLRVDELESVVAQMHCGKKQCADCEDYAPCADSLSSHMSQHERAVCYNGREAVVNWIALNDVHSFSVRAGTAPLPYTKIGPAFWRTTSNCYNVEFGATLKNPVVFVSLNHRSGADRGTPAPAGIPASVHLEGVSGTGFRVCYRLLVSHYEAQPQTQPDYIHVDWLAHHDG